ncbi:MAG: hypothetical protein ABWZ99_06970 [Ilumatobacteraceae bacterium]
MAGLRTEFDFTLPKGYISADGVLHRHGVMRLATARDEIEPLRDRNIDGPDDPYLTILVLARVITELGSVPDIGVEQVEGLFAADLAFLQDLYGIINFGDHDDVEALQASVLPDEPEPTAADTSNTVAGDDDAIEVEVIDDTVDDVPAAQPAPSRPASTNRRRAQIEEVSPAASQ